jgi:hypothetical protein
VHGSCTFFETRPFSLLYLSVMLFERRVYYIFQSKINTFFNLCILTAEHGNQLIMIYVDSLFSVLIIVSKQNKKTKKN